MAARESAVERREKKRRLIQLGGVYMIPARLSFRYEFTPVPSCGSVFVYMVSAQNLIPERVIPVRVHPGNCTGAKVSFRYENSFRCKDVEKLKSLEIINFESSALFGLEKAIV